MGTASDVQKAAGAKPEVKAKARDILYELSATLEGIKSKKEKERRGGWSC